MKKGDSTIIPGLQSSNASVHQNSLAGPLEHTAACPALPTPGYLLHESAVAQGLYFYQVPSAGGMALLVQGPHGETLLESSVHTC
jgi:hypothetical protein